MVAVGLNSQRSNRDKVARLMPVRWASVSRDQALSARRAASRFAIRRSTESALCSIPSGSVLTRSNSRVSIWRLYLSIETTKVKQSRKTDRLDCPRSGFRLAESSMTFRDYGSEWSGNCDSDIPDLMRMSNSIVNSSSNFAPSTSDPNLGNYHHRSASNQTCRCIVRSPLALHAAD